MSPAERIAFTSQPGIHDRFIRQLNEIPEAATARYQSLLADLLTWARSKTTIAPAGTSSSSSRSGSNSSSLAPAGGGGGGGGRSSRRSRSSSRPPYPRPALAAAADAADSDSDPDATTPRPPATAAPAALSEPARGGRRPPPPIFCYSGDRTADEAETKRRLRAGLCLHCPPGAPKPFGACPEHDTVTSAPACRPYRDRDA
jgi:hypothetical protein